MEEVGVYNQDGTARNTFENDHVCSVNIKQEASLKLKLKMTTILLKLEQDSLYKDVMSWQDLVSAQTSNVCITHHAALNAVRAKQFVMSLPAMSLGDWFSMSRKVGRGEVGWYIHPKSENSMVVCGFGRKKVHCAEH